MRLVILSVLAYNFTVDPKAILRAPWHFPKSFLHSKPIFSLRISKLSHLMSNIKLLPYIFIPNKLIFEIKSLRKTFHTTITTILILWQI